MQERYYKFSKYLKEKFGCRVYKASVDAGFLCPNKDGKFSSMGCIFCDNRSFSYNSRDIRRLLEEQISRGIDFGRKRYNAEKFIVYFQANTNTYAPLDVLKEKYDAVSDFKEVIGISIGTRPDCVNEDILDLINSYSSRYEMWIEYGLQSIHDKTLDLINRNHHYQDFLKAVELTKQRNIKACAHVIIGLPHETRDEILETAMELGHLNIDGVKIHHLRVVKDTQLERLFKERLYRPMGMDEFLDLTVEFLECLSPDTVVQRIGADCPQEFLTEPVLAKGKERMLSLLDEKLEQKNTFQGRKCSKETREEIKCQKLM